MSVKLSNHFTYKRLFLFVYPTIIMIIFTSIYSVVDGLFVSNFAGKIQFASVNLVLPVLTMISTIGFMIGSGGSAVVGISLGAKRKEKANDYFSMFLLAEVSSGLISGIFVIVNRKKYGY